MILTKKIDKINVGVIIAARNEEKFLPKTLESLSKQNFKPKKIVLVNDGSKDGTGNIALKYGCDVINLMDDGFGGQGGPKMTYLHEVALSRFDEDMDYILQLDADHIIPDNYILYLVSEMQKNPKLVIGGGLIDGIKSKTPMGSGRIVRFDFHKKIGFSRKTKHGLDTYPLLKAKQLGYEYQIFEIDTQMQRKQGETYNKENYKAIGKTCKALGYHPVFSLVLFLQRAINKRKIQVFFWQLIGMLSNDVDQYDEEFRKFVRKMQSELIRKKLKKFFFN